MKAQILQNIHYCPAKREQVYTTSFNQNDKLVIFCSNCLVLPLVSHQNTSLSPKSLTLTFITNFWILNFFGWREPEYHHCIDCCLITIKIMTNHSKNKVFTRLVKFQNINLVFLLKIVFG